MAVDKEAIICLSRVYSYYIKLKSHQKSRKLTDIYGCVQLGVDTNVLYNFCNNILDAQQQLLSQENREVNDDKQNTLCISIL